MYPSLANKRVVVTGGASGIGRAVVERFKDEGARVFVFDMNAAGVEALIKEGVAQGGYAGDVGDPEAVTAAFESADRELEGVDVLIANAGISFRTAFSELDASQWRRVMRSNLDGAFYCAHGAARRMLARTGGTILFTASTNGLSAHVHYSDYNASKAAVLLLMRTMARELAPRIRVNAVSPGYVLTPMQLAEYTPAMLTEVNSKLPLQRHAEPSEVAALFAFLASDEARYITGQNIVIDGGETA